MIFPKIEEEHFEVSTIDDIFYLKDFVENVFDYNKKSEVAKAIAIVLDEKHEQVNYDTTSYFAHCYYFNT